MDPGNPMVALRLALARLQDGDPAEAAKLFAEIAERFNVAEAWLGLAASRLQTNQPALAAAAMQACLSRHAAIPSMLPLAAAIAAASDAPGWCAIDVQGRLHADGPADAALDGVVLVPLDAPLELEAALPGAEAGFVHPGDPVTIKFDTFPYTQYGGARGQVRSVSPDSFTTQADERTRAGVVNASGSAQPGSSYFRLNVSLDAIDLHDTPHGFHVTPGMPITADVLVGKRTVVSYIMSRALPVFMDGMREP